MCMIATVIIGDDGTLSIKPCYSQHVRLQKRQRKGGQSAQRIGRLRDEAHHQYISTIVDKMEQVFNENPVLGLVLAGPSLKKEALRKRLPTPYQDCLLGMVTVSDRLSIDQLKPHLRPLIDNHRYAEDVILLSQLQTMIEQENAKFVYGRRDVRHALAQQRLETLIIHQQILDQKHVDVDKLEAKCKALHTTLVILQLYNADAEAFIEGYGGYVGGAWY